LAGPRLSEAGYAGGDLIQPTVFAVIVATVILHGFSLGPLTRRLGLSTAAETQRLAVVGASPWASEMVVALHRAGVPVVLIDTYSDALQTAGDAGVPTLQAELLSRHAEEGPADHPPDHLLASTRDELYNALVCTRLAPEIGRERVYQLAPSADHLLHQGLGVGGRRTEARQSIVRHALVLCDDLHVAQFPVAGRFLDAVFQRLGD
jgi:hypothetical protein